MDIEASLPSPDARNFRDEATQVLLERLGRIAASGKTMFGMANANTHSYRQGFQTPPDYSDCHAATGSHPAFVEDDFMWFTDLGEHKEHSAAQVRARHLAALRSAHHRGAVCGYCWHLGGKESHSFRHVLDWGPHKGQLSPDAGLARAMVQEYRQLRIALAGIDPASLAGTPRPAPASALGWFYGLLDTLVVPVFRELGFPLVFRPFHEMNGNWFWWGSDAISPAEYQELFHLTVDYIRAQGVRNVLYAWSPNAPFSTDCYPGDSHVDILGLDSYEPGVLPAYNAQAFASDLRSLDSFARAHGKLAALTETGCRKDGEVFRYPVQEPEFWTRCVLQGLKDSRTRMVWAMSWYQIDFSRHSHSQFYIPYPGMEKEHENGQKALEDFRRFAADPQIIMEDRLHEFS